MTPDSTSAEPQDARNARRRHQAVGRASGAPRAAGAGRDKVPAAYIGMGRELRRQASIAYVQARQGGERLLKPLRPRERFTPMPSHDRLSAIAAAWRSLPAFGRLGLVAAFEDGTLGIAEMRLKPVRMRFNDWDGEDLEPALAVLLRLVRVKPPAYREQEHLLVDIGLHSIARRFQRGERSNEAVLADIETLAKAHGAAVASGETEFRIATGNGFWLGEITKVRGLDLPVLAVRTFVDG